MEIAPLPPDESARLDALYRYEILDTASEEAFDDLTCLAAKICGSPIALVSLIDPHRQWFKAKVGVTVCETSRDMAFCAHTILQRAILEVPDALADPRFATNPLVTRDPFIRFYAGIPLVTPEGHALGTLCVIDRVPRQLTSDQRQALTILGRQVVNLLELRLRRALLKQSEAAQQQAEQIQAQLHFALNHGFDGAAMLDREGRYTYVNQAHATLYGYEAVELIGQPWTVLYSPEWRTKIIEEFFPVLHQQGYWLGEVTGKRKSGEAIIAEISLTCLTAEDTSGNWLLCTCRDITAKKMAQYELSRTQARLRSVLDSATGVSIIATDLHGLITVFNKGAERLLGYSAEEMIGKQTPASFHLPEEIVAHSRSLTARFGREIEGFDVFVELARLGGSEEREWTYVRKDGERRIVNLVVTAVRSDDDAMTGYLGIASDITERKQSEETFRLAKFSMERAADAIYWIDPQAKILDVNEAASLMLGYTRDELCAMTVHDLNPEFQADMWPDFWTETRRGGTMAIETVHRAKNGRLIPIEVSVNYLVHEGKEYHCAFVRNITERKLAEEALREVVKGVVAETGENFFPSFVCRLAKVLKVQYAYVSEMNAERTGFRSLAGWGRGAVLPPFEVPAAGPCETVLTGQVVHHPDHLPAIYPHIRLIADLGVVSYCGVSIADRRGRVFGHVAIMDDKPMPNAKLAIAILQVFASRIAGEQERKQADATLRESEQRYKTLVQSAPFCIHEIDLQGRLLSMNPAGLGMMGARDEQEIVSVLYLDVVAPADRTRVEALLARACAGEASTFEFSIDGGQADCCVASCFLPIKNDDGVVTRLMGITQDITERKRAEHALREREEALSRFKTTLDQTHDCVFMFAPDTLRFIYCNRGAVAQVGYTEAELLTMTPLDIKPEFTEQRFREMLQPLREGDGAAYVFETVHQHKDGHTVAVEISLQLVREQGREERFVAVVRDITERKCVEALLQEREAGLMAAQELAHLGSWEWDTQTGVERWSAEQYRIFGYAPNSIEPTYDLFKQALHIEDRAKVLAAVEASFDERAPYHVECRIVHPSGAVRSVQCRGEVDRDATGKPVRMRGIVLDITERKQAEAKLLVSDAFNISVLNSLSAQIAVVNPQGVITSVNESWRRFAIENGAPQIAEHSMGMNYFDVCGRADGSACAKEASAAQSGIRRVLAGAQDEYNLEYSCDSPEQQRWILMHVTPLGSSQGGVVIAHEDITERKRLEQQLTRYAEEVVQKNSSLEIAMEQASAAVTAKSMFLATMSHEIRTPMNGVIGMTGLLLDTDLTPLQREFAETVRNSGDHLLTIINDILDFSKIEAGKMNLEIIDFDLRTAVNESVDLLADRASRKGLNLACLFHADVPAALHGDPGRIRQILINLMGNAIKFTEQGEVVVSITLAHQTETESTVRFEVHDTGIGLSPDTQDRLFQSFMQADSSTTRKFGGTGLGLVICKQLTELMGGHIGVESRLGEGSRFWFVVPFGKQEEKTASGSVMAFQGFHGLQICIVDNSPINRRILEVYFNRWEVRCLIAGDGQRALALMREAAAQGHPCDVAIIDMQLPDMNGLELGSAIKADPVLAVTRLVLLTSQGRRGDAKEAQAVGYAGYLTKPVYPPQLYECLTLILQSSAQTTVQEGQSAGLTARPELVTRHTLAEKNTQAAAKVLVVDDDVVTQKVVIRILEKLGYQGDFVANGLEAIEALTRITYAAVLMDIHMPEMNGFEATQEIRRREATGKGQAMTDSGTAHLASAASSHVAIIAMTSDVRKESRDRCLAAGMDDCVRKPVQPEMLAETLARWLSAPDSRPTATKDRPLRIASAKTAC